MFKLKRRKKMKVEVRNTTVDIDINGITLLSKEEYITYKNEISNVDNSWWLRSPDSDDIRVAAVSGIGSIYYFIGDTAGYNVGVRPALKINLESSSSRVGDGFLWAHHSWTVISENYAICDSIIEKRPFNENLESGNDYNVSDIKSWLENWFNSNIEE